MTAVIFYSDFQLGCDGNSSAKDNNDLY